MLLTLAIKNLAVIEDIVIDFHSHFTVLTGETGAGKSIIIDALKLVLGERADNQMIRLGCDSAEIEGVFELVADHPAIIELEKLQLVDIEKDRVQLIIRRTLKRNGRSRIYLNNRLATVRDLQHFISPLIDIASQHQYAELMSPSSHLHLLDKFGEHQPFITEYQKARVAYQKQKAIMLELLEKQQKKTEREAFLRFQKKELDELNLIAGEDEELQTEHRRLAYSQELGQNSQAAQQTIEQAVQQSLRAANRSVERLIDRDETLEPLKKRLESAVLELEDIAMELRHYHHNLDHDPARLANVNERLNAVEKVKRKHLKSLEEIIAFHADLNAQLSAFETLDWDQKAAEKELLSLRKKTIAAGLMLAQQRNQASLELLAKIHANLASLAMPHAELRFEWQMWQDEFGDNPKNISQLLSAKEFFDHGLMIGELYVQTNVGQGFGPLKQVASGGELSRILLAIKSIMADSAVVSIFDEIDTGTSGDIAGAIADRLADISHYRQVIAITHLPQIAARATQHFHVKKVANDHTTTTTIDDLDFEARIDEIAQMFGGKEVGKAGRDVAEALLKSTSSTPSSRN